MKLTVGAGRHVHAALRWRTPRVRACVLGALCLPALASAGCGTAGNVRAAQVIRVTPGDGSKDVRAHAPLEVKAPDGRLQRVRVSRAGRASGAPLHGRISSSGRVWRPARDERGLALASEYTVDAVALDGSGRRTARHTTFSTRVPEHRFIGFFTPEQGQTVGTGMIVSLDFSRAITERAAVERAISVRSDPAVPIAAHWFGDRRLDFRPRGYWAPGTRITLTLRLRDVRGAPGAYGSQRKTVHFTVGRDQRSVIDARRHSMTVLRGGEVAGRVPVTAGDDENPTYGGTMVISEKHDETRMDSRTVGFGGEYDIADVPHAMRLTESGTFLHGNYWAKKGTFGHENVSHGCVGLRDEKGGSGDSPAGRFYRSSLVGDPVTVERSGERTVSPDNGLGGWNMPWAEWKAGSAVN